MDQKVETQGLERHADERRSPAPWLSGLFAGVCLYFFLSAIGVMGSGLKLLGKHTDWLENLLAHGETNPVIALFAAVLVTATVQSSSFTTSLIIAFVGTQTAAGDPILSLDTAVYAVMGANIGTSVTNIIVALGNVRIRRQFRRAFTAALVHDIFNWLTVALLFPLEWITSALHRANGGEGLGLLARTSLAISDKLGLSEMEKPDSPIKVITRPVVNAAEWVGDHLWPTPVESAYEDAAVFAEALHQSNATEGVIIAMLGLAMLFTSLMFLVTNLKGALLRQIENLFRKVFFRSDGSAYVVGAVTTVLVQSSSVTTSLIVPLAGAGVVRLKRVFAYTLGANLGTTMTGVIAASANPVPLAVSVAISHVSFNLIGTAIWYPLRTVPIELARSYGRLAARSKRYALLFLVLVFVVLPLIAIGLVELLASAPTPEG